MKKVVSLLAALTLLATVAVLPVTADSSAIEAEVQNSITEEEETGLGLAFLYTVNATDVKVEGTNTFAGGKIQYNGTSATLVTMGAVVANTEEAGTDPAAMVRENVTGVSLIDIEAVKLWGLTDTTLSFAVRVIHVPEENRKTTVYARPYYVVEDDQGNRETVYGAITSSSYFSVWCDNQPAVILPTVGTDIDVVKQKNRIHVSAAEIVDRTVTLTFQNDTANKATKWITEETDYVVYTCYDAEGKKLEDGTIYIGCIDTKKNKVKDFTFDVPDATTEVKLTNSKITYWTEWA